MSWLHPRPRDMPVRLPRRLPVRAVPSFIGEPNQVLNLLMHHGGGNVVRDHSPYGNHGKVVECVWRDGAWGWALETKPNTGYIEIPHSASLDLTIEDFTFVCWVYVYPDQHKYGSIACKGEWGVDGYGFGAEQGVRRFCFYDRGRSAKYCTTLVYENNKWYCFAVTRSGLTVRLYVNSELDSEHTLDGDLIPSSQPMVVGGISPPVTPFSHIMVAMLQLYKGVAKPDAWIKRFYEETRALFGS